MEWFRINSATGEIESVEPPKANTEIIKAYEHWLKRGKWEWLGHSKYRCTACERATYVETVMNKPAYDFCPHCGARMDGDNQ